MIKQVVWMIAFMICICSIHGMHHAGSLLQHEIRYENIDDDIRALAALELDDVPSAMRQALFVALDAYKGPAKRLEHFGHVRSVAWHPSLELLASASDDGLVRVWNPELNLSKRLLFHDFVSHVAWDPQGTTLASGCEAGIVQLWDVESGNEYSSMTFRDIIKDLAWSSDGNRIAIAEHGNGVHILDTRSMNVMNVPMEDNTNACAVAWKPGANILAIGCRDGRVRIWDVVQNRETMNNLPHASYVLSLGWNKTGEKLAVSTADRRVSIIKPLSDNINYVFVEPERCALASENIVTALAWHPIEDRLALTVGDRTLSVWEDSSKSESRRLPETSWMWSVDWNRDGTKLATGSTGKVACIWDDVAAYDPARYRPIDYFIIDFLRRMNHAGLPFDVHQYPALSRLLDEAPRDIKWLAQKLT